MAEKDVYKKAGEIAVRHQAEGESPDVRLLTHTEIFTEAAQRAEFTTAENLKERYGQTIGSVLAWVAGVSGRTIGKDVKIPDQDVAKGKTCNSR